MEAKFLAAALSFLSIFLAIYAQSSASDIANESDGESKELLPHDFSTPIIYYGDASVNIGQPFEILCVIPISEKIHWLRNNESITRHNFRHGHDDHSYQLSESAIEGESHKIEAQLKVRHALKVHEGRYQCNNNHRHGNGFHMLRVNSKESLSSTESGGGYQTIDEMTPSSPNDVFTKTWKEQQMPHNPHNNRQPAQQPQQHYSYGAVGNASYNEFTTQWYNTPASGGQDEGAIHRIYSATAPFIPPPRWEEHTVARPEAPTILYNQTLLNTATDDAAAASSSSPSSSSSASATITTTPHHRTHHQQQQLQKQSQHILNAYQLPVPPQHSGHRNEKYQTYSPQFLPTTAIGGDTVTSATTLFTTAHNNNNYGQMQQQPKMLLPIQKGPESLVPKYENVEKQMVFYNIRSHLILSCEVKIGNYSDLIWKKNDTLVNDVKTLIGRFRIIKAEGKFVIDKADVIDDGRYSCELNGVSKNITAIAKPIVRVPSNHGVVEGEKLTIPCTAVGSQPRLSWSFGNYTNVTESTGRYILKKDESSNVENSILIIENVTLDDRGDYKCSGHNAAPDDANDTATVRVKGKFAALWPFLGICAEVLILCLIILIYEKRRNKSELEESDTDPQEQKKKRRNYD
ncbi:uncharacterized protein LOC132791097 isoform X1 [Drosophila nasuta]|uniref:uncharacterized protein LOC132791097 isoform X1 n=1 Tax=Drosophila nasuta TaxID=42062 RepID=UPI00295EB5A9|nr:uncharacterized protein LOC132791097 isoform X1 [Drosophila nasuta]XP_060655893.1 uncharacterized protein LOC132791097 isoform X1 [Drosophila nasuta]XP_060655900.1 uncharacterized protein LOC132791097 isoform X1 [Drosophila nasuta]XP_060655908.1 uncharacterized protein LOC132791097 isoform X1 [Drosophila nasuta]XP_060655915.1 uncharacterized protein LOC132791097 isoform X1 [Drosophila nasuta]XP_060655923.1 uncharacterized protein LOC132791097 isoform X1 [Drosophila nasuta]XP_060655932.1 un